MDSQTYDARRGRLETYFDRTAVDAWEKLTSDAPVSGIRATVRAGRDTMRANLLARLPEDMTGMTLLDAGCGTGALSLIAASRGAKVTATDISPNLIEIAKTRAAEIAPGNSIDFRAGDMLDPALGGFDYVVAMDSLIHYKAGDIIAMLSKMAERTSRAIIFTFAPRTPALMTMHTAGLLFPRADRAPAIEPVAEKTLAKLIGTTPELADWDVAYTERVSSGFYKSQAMEITRR